MVSKSRTVRVYPLFTCKPALRMIASAAAALVLGLALAVFST
jgi:hypothetical protein